MGDYAQSDFDTLYRDNYNNLLRLAYRSTKDYHESEDLVDEAFVIYLQKSGTVHISNPRAYLIKIMSNLICNYLRLKMHDNVPLSDALENEIGVIGFIFPWLPPLSVSVALIPAVEYGGRKV